MDREQHPKKYKILFVAHSMRYAGAEKALLNILKNLDRDVFTPYVACPKGPLLEKIVPLCEEVLILREGVIPVLFRPLDYLNSAFRLMVFLVPNTVATIKFIRKKKCDLVFSNTSVILHGMLAARVVGVPAVVMIHEIILPRVVGGLIARLTSFLSDKAVAISNAILAAFVSSGGNRSKAVRVNCAIDLRETDILGEIPLNKYRVDENTLVIGLVGDLTPRKGHSYFIQMAAEVLKELKQVRFFIIGDYLSNPRYYRKLEDLSNDLKVSGHLTFTGAIPNLTVTSLFRRLNILTVSSVMETLSLAALEAMALRKPVVAFDVGGVGEAVTDHVTGRLIPFGDYKAMARAIVAILKDDKVARAMGEEGRKKLEGDFSLETQTYQLHELFLDVIRSKKGQGSI